MADFCWFQRVDGSPSSFPTSEGFCGLGDGKPSPLADAILRGPGADGKPISCGGVR